MVHRALVCAVAVLLLATSALAAGGEWQKLACVPDDSPTEASFDVVQAVDDFESPPLKWKALQGEQLAAAKPRRDTAEHHQGDAALRVDYRFTGTKDADSIQLNAKFDLPRPKLGFGLWVKTDGTPLHFHLRIADSGDETHQFLLPTVHRPGWQFVETSLDTPSGSRGGDGNHRVDYPCRLVGIIVNAPYPEFEGEGALWIDDVSLVRPRSPAASSLTVQVQGLRFGNVYRVGEEVALRARGQGERIRWQATDFWGETIAQDEGPATGTTARFDLKRSGYFLCALELLAGGQTKERQYFTAASLPAGVESGRSDFIGMCTHFCSGGRGYYPLDCMTLLRRYGIDQFRDANGGWNLYERVRGNYEMPPPAAAFLRKATQLKMRPLLTVCYSNHNYDKGGFPNSSETIAAFAAYAADLVRRTRGVANAFEVWNEWVNGTGMEDRSGVHDGAAYGRLLRPTYAAIKRVSPHATVVGIGGENPFKSEEKGPTCAQTIAAALKTAGTRSMDAWSIHPYRYWSPEDSDLAGEVRRIAEQVAEAGAKQKAWVTEIGWPTHHESGQPGGFLGVGEKSQALYAVRALTLLQSTQRVEKVFWYDFVEDGLDRDELQDHFGVAHHEKYNCAPKPAIVAISVFVWLTQNAPCSPLERQGSAWFASYALPHGKQCLVAWATKPNTPVRVSGNLDALYDLMGNTVEHASPLMLGPAPIYLTGQDLRLQTAAP